MRILHPTVLEPSPISTSERPNGKGHELERCHAKSSTCGVEGHQGRYHHILTELAIPLGVNLGSKFTD